MGASPPEAGVLPSVDDAVALGLTRAEYDLVCDKLGRAPNQVELAMFSLLWSEHCAYQHSKKLLRTLPTEGRHVLMGPGENSGAVDVGRGRARAGSFSAVPAGGGARPSRTTPRARWSRARARPRASAGSSAAFSR